MGLRFFLWGVSRVIEHGCTHSLSRSMAWQWLIFDTITLSYHRTEFQSTSWWVAQQKQRIRWRQVEREKDNLKERNILSDPISAPPVPYSLQPAKEGKGKLLFITGPPGSGKSTSAQLLARERGQFSGIDLLANYLCQESSRFVTL